MIYFSSAENQVKNFNLSPQCDHLSRKILFTVIMRHQCVIWRDLEKFNRKRWPFWAYARPFVSSDDYDMIILLIFNLYLHSKFLYLAITMK